LEFRHEKLPQINRKFDEIQSQIEFIDVENFEENEQEREKIKIAYFAIGSQM